MGKLNSLISNLRNCIHRNITETFLAYSIDIANKIENCENCSEMFQIETFNVELQFIRKRFCIL